MNEKHNYKLLRPVKFKDVQVGDVLILKDGAPVSKSSVAYKADKFVVLRLSDGSEGTCYRTRLEIDYGLAPLCWVEGKPVYPGDVLYYRHSFHWQHNDEGAVVSSVNEDELLFQGGMVSFPIADATWIKPEQKPVPSFQVEGQDVFPGDTVYYYGVNSTRWGVAVTVEANGCILNEFGQTTPVGDYEQGVATFRLKPMLVIGDHLVPMPVRGAAEMKKGDAYYTPSLDSKTGYLGYTWSNRSFDIEMCDKGLVHRTKEAAVAHTKAFIALSKKKD